MFGDSTELCHTNSASGYAPNITTYPISELDRQNGTLICQKCLILFKHGLPGE